MEVHGEDRHLAHSCFLFPSFQSLFGSRNSNPRCMDLPLLLCPTHPLILLLPPPLLPLDLVLIHRPPQCSCAYFMEAPAASCAGHAPAKEGAFLLVTAFRYVKGVPGRGCASSSTRAVLSIGQKCSYQVNLPCFEEKHRCTISPFFQPPFTVKAADTNAEKLSVQGTVWVEFQ